MNNKKKIILSVLVVLLLLAIGVTYAFFTYESGTKSDIVTGQIYMNYEETNTISLTGVFPETKEQALARQDENGVFEFTITGRNTSKYPVYYEIDLLEGGVMTGKTEQSTRLLPEHVRIYLERDGEPLVDGMTYKDWNNRRIYVDTVPENTTSNIEHKYTLRMWIDENVTISDTDPNADYTTSEWNDAYTSLKVRVVGDFEYKEVATDASCFAYNVIVPEGYIAYDYPIITLDTSEEKVNTCKEFLLNDCFGGNDNSDAQDGYQSYCEGTGTIFDGYDLRGDIAEGGYSQEQIQSLGVVSNITYETRYYELNTSEESVNTCKEFMLNVVFAGEDNSDAGDGFQSFCEGIGTWVGDTIYEVDMFHPSLLERNVFVQVEEISQVIEITYYDETCGTDVIIPSTIEGLPVTRIAGYTIPDSTEWRGAFAFTNITNVKLPETLQYIGEGAFMDNNLTEVIILDSVTEIDEGAFIGNNLTNVEIGTGIMNIGDYAFGDNPLVTVNIKNNPSLGVESFDSSYRAYNNNFQLFQYAGTCEELNQSFDIFGIKPIQIITNGNNECAYTNVRGEE